MSVAQVLIWLLAAGATGQAAVHLAALAGAVLHYVSRSRATNARPSLRAFIGHLFPLEILTSYWTYADLLFYAMIKLVGILLYALAGALTVLSASLVRFALMHAVGPGPMLALSGWTLVSFLVVGLLVRDFVSFYIHMMQHRIPLLWEFHKVHHAPETIIPITGHRLHPLEHLFNLAGDSPALGILVGIFAWLTNQGLETLILCSASIQALVNMLTFAPLRHSHIDLRLGWAERFLLSPAHHRLHHSVEIPHWDKNFAAVFPFWDRMWRTIMTPPPINSYRIGLPQGESACYTTLVENCFTPLHSSVRRIRSEGWAKTLRPAALASKAPPRQRSRVTKATVAGSTLTTPQ